MEHFLDTWCHIPGRAVLQVTLLSRLWSCICWTFWIRKLHFGTSQCLNTPHQALPLSTSTGGAAGSKQACNPSGKQQGSPASLATEGNNFHFTCRMSRKSNLTRFVVVVSFVINYIHPSYIKWLLCGCLCVSTSEKELTWGGRGEADRVSGAVWSEVFHNCLPPSVFWYFHPCKQRHVSALLKRRDGSCFIIFFTSQTLAS